MNLDEECAICGLKLKEKYSYQLNCNHCFHYDCLLKTFNNHYNKKNRRCPYCKNKSDHLPLINGIKKPIENIHYTTQIELDNLIIKNERCCHILTKGKRKGDKCNKKCKLGYYYCQCHLN